MMAPLGVLCAKDIPPSIRKAISQVRSFCKKDMNVNFHDYIYEGTIAQFTLREKKYWSVQGLKYWSVQGSLENLSELPAGTIVVRGKHIPNPSRKGGGGYFFCNGKSGEVIGYLLTK